MIGRSDPVETPGIFATFNSWGRVQTAKPHVQSALVVCALAALLSIVFWRVTIQRHILSPADLVFQSYPWIEAKPAGYAGPSNPWQSDDAYLYYPRRHSLFDGQAGGSWWQDEYLTGARNTFSNDFLGAEYYPPGLWFRLLPTPEANTAFHLSILFIAGVSMFLLLRQLRLPRIAAGYGGMLFMLNGHFMVWLGAWSLPAMLGLVPLILYGFEKWTETKKPGWLLIPSACIALQMMISYLPALVVTGTILGVYGTVRLAPVIWARARKEIALRVGAYTSAGIAGIALAAYSLIPSLASALGSSYQQDRALGLAHIPLENAWTFMFPDFFGGPRNWFGFGGNYPEWVAYAGISAVPLLAPGLWRLRRHWLGWFSFIVIAFSAAQLYGIPPLKEFAHLPGMRQVAATRWFFGLDLGAALIAPAGLAALIEPDRDPRVRRALMASVGALAVLAIVAITILYLDRHGTANWTWITEGRHFIPRPWGIVSEIKTASTEFHRQVALFLIACGLVSAASLMPNRARPAACALFVVAFLDLFAFGQHYNATVARTDLYPETPGLEYLQSDQGLFRIAPVWSDGTTMVLPGYTPNLYGLNTITGYDHYKDPDYLDFLAPLLSANDVAVSNLYGYVTVGTNRQPLNENILALLNVKYIVAPPNGLFEMVGGQTKNEQAFPVYAGHGAGQTIALPEGADSVEFLLATGGGPPPDAAITISARSSPSATNTVASVTVQSEDVRDNNWYRLDLPSLTGHDAFLEISAADAGPDHPYYVWGAAEGAGEGSQRYESGSAVDGSLTFRVLKQPDDLVKPVYQGADLSIYELNAALPRAWGVANSVTLTDRAAAMKRVAEVNFDPARQVVFEGSFTQLDSQRAVQTTIEHYSPGDITVHTSGAGWAVFSERYDGGWKATVDGKDTPVLRADGILMAVPVELGEHEVKLTFEPPEYVWGERISLATVGLLVLAVGGYIAYVRRRRKPAG